MVEFNGVLNVYKPMGYTSRDVVNIVKKIYKLKKVGHAGTLDPNVTGVLPICIGSSTKLVEYIQSMGKSYVGEMTLGINTDTLDIWGKVISSKEIIFDKKEFLEKINMYNDKKILQLPPMFSSLKKDGKRLYEYARAGIEVEREKREVHIYSVDILNIYQNKIRLKVKCSKGTYIRTFFNDIAREINQLSYMNSLCRDSYGIFNIENSITLEKLKTLDEEKLKSILKKPQEVLLYERIDFSKKHFKHISNGLRKTFDIDKEGVFKIYCDNIFIGIGELVPFEDKKILKITNMFYRQK